MTTTGAVRNHAREGLSYRNLSIRRIDRDQRTVEVAFATDTPVERWFGTEVLRISEAAIRLDRLRNGAAVLVDHDWSAQVGVVEAVRIGREGIARATLRFGRGERATEIFGDIVDGIRRHVSVGYAVHASEVTARTGAPDLVEVTDWEPFEISVVAVPADTAAGVGRSDHRREQSMTETTTDETRARATARQGQGQGQSPDTPETHEDRVAAVLELGTIYNADDLAVQTLRAGGGPEDLQRAILDRMNRHGRGVLAEETFGEIGLSAGERARFSLMALVRYLAAPDESSARAAGLELEASRAFAQRAGRDPQGAYVPPDVIFDPGFVRALGTGTDAAGGALVATQTLGGSFIDVLRNRLSIMEAGATMLSGLVGKVRVPRLAGGATSEWLPEAGAVSDSAPSFETVALSPHTIAASVPMTRRLLIQSTPEIEVVIRNELVQRVALGIDAAALNGDASDNAPTGLRELIVGSATDWTADAAPTHKEIVALETAVASATADRGNLAYLYGAAMSGHLKTTALDTGSGAFLENPDGTVNGHRRVITNQVQAGDVFFGNWSDLILGMWSGLDLRVDTATLASSDGVVLRAFQDVDVGVRHPESFALGRTAPL